MYRVFLIDDEPWAMVSLERLIDWKSLGFEITAKIDNARTAWEQIQRDKPDVILTDIRMPGLSGLELLGKIRETSLPVEVVLVSAFADFSYAQEAIRKGALEYLLKPVRRDRLESCVQQIAQKLEHSSQIRERNEAAKGRELLASCSTAGEAMLALTGAAPARGERIAVISCGEAVQERFSAELAALCSWARIRLSDSEILYLCATANGEERLEDLFYRALAQEGEYGAFGMSVEQTGQESLEHLVWNARVARHTAEFVRQTGLRYDAGKAGYDREVELIKAVQYNQRAMIADHLQSLRREMTAGHVMLDRFFALLRGMNRFYMQEQGNPSLFPLSWKQYPDILGNYPHEDDLFEKLFGIFLVNEEDKWIVPVLEEIELRFDQARTLEAIAQELGISQAGLSQTIRRHTGKTYSELLQEKRMEKARELLAYSEETVTAVAELVGYSDQFYFSKVFKRIYGLSPNSYRKQVRSGNEITKYEKK